MSRSAGKRNALIRAMRNVRPVRLSTTVRMYVSDIFYSYELELLELELSLSLSELLLPPSEPGAASSSGGGSGGSGWLEPLSGAPAAWLRLARPRGAPAAAAPGSGATSPAFCFPRKRRGRVRCWACLFSFVVCMFTFFVGAFCLLFLLLLHYDVVFLLVFFYAGPIRVPSSMTRAEEAPPALPSCAAVHRRTHQLDLASQ